MRYSVPLGGSAEYEKLDQLAVAEGLLTPQACFAVGRVICGQREERVQFAGLVSVPADEHDVATTLAGSFFKSKPVALRVDGYADNGFIAGVVLYVGLDTGTEECCNDAGCCAPGATVGCHGCSVFPRLVVVSAKVSWGTASGYAVAPARWVLACLNSMAERVRSPCFRLTR
jgi:hypothetical protein